MTQALRSCASFSIKPGGIRSSAVDRTYRRSDTSNR